MYSILFKLTQKEKKMEIVELPHFFDISIYKNARHVISMRDARCIAHACYFIFIVFIMNRGYARCSIKTNIRIGV